MNGDRVISSIIYSPEDRKRMKVEGITREMLIRWIDDVLAQAIASIDKYPIYLIIDKASIHNTEKMMEAFRDRGCQDLKEIIVMPTKSAKRLSPLDNAFFHEWKERVRKNAPLTKNNIVSIMHNELYNISSNHLANYYRHCALTDGQDPYKDCPLPSDHDHA